jgi:hypothetical protein
MKLHEFRKLIREEIQRTLQNNRRESFLNESSSYPERFETSEEEHEYLISTKPKNTFKQLVSISKPLLKRFVQLKAEDIINTASKKNDPSKTKQVKEEFKKTLMRDSEFWKLWSSKWQNTDSVLSNLFHTLYYYHFN